MRLGVRESFALHPVGEGDRAAGLHDAGGFGDEGGLVDDVAPGVLAPDEIGGGGRKAGGAGVGEDAFDAVRGAFGFAAGAAVGDGARRGVDAAHRGGAAEADEEAHARAAAAAEIHAVEIAGETGRIGQSVGGGHPADVDLFAHDEFPEGALRAAVDGFDVVEGDGGERFHGVLVLGAARPGPRSAMASTGQALLHSWQRMHSASRLTAES